MKTNILQAAVIFILIFVSSVVFHTGNALGRDSEKTYNTTKRSFIENGEPNLTAIIKHIDDMYRSRSSISRLKLIVTKLRNKRTLTMKTWTKGEEKVLVIIEAPPREKGTATLKIERNLWNYLPRIRRTIRIPPSMMLTSWMGSDFTNDDLVHEASFHKDYEYSLERVACVGSCANAPVLLIDDDVYAKATPVKTNRLLTRDDESGGKKAKPVKKAKTRKTKK